jgi:hypothetical protein
MKVRGLAVRIEGSGTVEKSQQLYRIVQEESNMLREQPA